MLHMFNYLKVDYNLAIAIRPLKIQCYPEFRQISIAKHFIVPFYNFIFPVCDLIF